MAKREYKMVKFRDDTYGVEVFERKWFRMQSIGFLDMQEHDTYIWSNFVKHGRWAKGTYEKALSKFYDATAPVAQYLAEGATKQPAS